MIDKPLVVGGYTVTSDMIRALATPVSVERSEQGVGSQGGAN
jgi:hypothetical protein